MSGTLGPTTSERLFPPTPDPARKPRWYRRRAVLVAGGVVVVVGAAVISDFSHPDVRAPRTPRASRA